jgi:DNA-binding MarR family transcriptional regulator
MKSERAALVDEVSSQLLPRAALLTRLLVARLGGELSRTEVGLLNVLSDGPRRITELAALERLAQPTMTQLVQRLEGQGLVVRERLADDGRVVLVTLTDAGSAALRAFRAEAATTLGAYLDEMSDDELAALAAATESFGHLVALLQSGDATGTPSASRR